jgi:hypothetical protein
VVHNNGNISHVKITQNGREYFYDEVSRVINKMSNRKLGLQNGCLFTVYFRMPSKFVNKN